MFRSILLDRCPWLRYGLSDKSDGSMRLFPVGHGEADKTKENRTRYLLGQGLSADRLVLPELVHSTNVRFVTVPDLGQSLSRTDGVVTDEADLILAVTAADCLPIFMVDSHMHRIGMVHAGWRGIVGKIIETACQQFAQHGSRFEDLIVVIGPHVQKQHFEIQTDIVEHFRPWSSRVLSVDGRLFVDLAGIVVDQLSGLGISSDHIEVSEISTFDSTNYFSYRRDKPEIIETMMAWMMIKS